MNFILAILKRAFIKKALYATGEIIVDKISTPDAPVNKRQARLPEPNTLCEITSVDASDAYFAERKLLKGKVILIQSIRESRIAGYFSVDGFIYNDSVKTPKWNYSHFNFISLRRLSKMKEKTFTNVIGLPPAEIIAEENQSETR